LNSPPLGTQVPLDTPLLAAVLLIYFPAELKYQSADGMFFQELFGKYLFYLYLINTHINISIYFHCFQQALSASFIYIDLFISIRRRKITVKRFDTQLLRIFFKILPLFG